jgi:hypothetical protein
MNLALWIIAGLSVTIAWIHETFDPFRLLVCVGRFVTYLS